LQETSGSYSKGSKEGQGLKRKEENVTNPCYEGKIGRSNTLMLSVSCAVQNVGSGTSACRTPRSDGPTTIRGRSRKGKKGKRRKRVSFVEGTGTGSGTSGVTHGIKSSWDTPFRGGSDIENFKKKRQENSREKRKKEKRR